MVNPAGITFLGTESLQDLGGSVRMSFQPALNDDFVGLELTFAQRLVTTLDVILCTSPFSKISPSRPNKMRGKGTKRKSQNKMNKSFC
jgi:hypothetical protein